VLRKGTARRARRPAWHVGRLLKTLCGFGKLGPQLDEANHDEVPVNSVSNLKPFRISSLAALLFAAILALAPSARCQDAPPSEPNNEFGAWAGYSWDSVHLIGTAEHRQLILAALRYTRKLHETPSTTLRYTIDIFPLAMVLEPKVLGVTPPPNSMFIEGPRQYVYGGGVNPIGLKLNFLRQHQLQPFVASSIGFVSSVERVPNDVPRGTLFNFTFDLQAGVERFNSERTRAWTLGYRFQHISNGFRTPVNPGMDSNVIFLGYSFFK